MFGVSPASSLQFALIWASDWLFLHQLLDVRKKVILGKLQPSALDFLALDIFATAPPPMRCAVRIY